ncbi:hypothetical protein C7B82_08255 [Stenomitos frigidus ULC18]|uniref:Uncharacterized protein n=1 Tax=Stenomitos frigidus ULC18 TaxID=2107698 RepID=A0A2T1EDM2_9CYAN|nr:hypothetical protein C7B82_08255 [Stenomitos frigidus ULC18]
MDLPIAPLTTALTDNLLGAFASTNKTQSTASTTNILGVFGQTGNPEKPVQRLTAEPANKSLYGSILAVSWNHADMPISK